MLISFFLVIITSIYLTVPGWPSPRFHVEAWLPFRNREMKYYETKITSNQFFFAIRLLKFKIFKIKKIRQRVIDTLMFSTYNELSL